MKYYTTNPALGIISDLSTRALFEKIADNINQPCDTIHAYNNTFHEVAKFKLTEKLIVIAVDDNMEYVPEYNWWSKTPEPELYKILYQMATDNPDREFVFLLQGRYWQTNHFAPLTNVRVVDWTIGEGDRIYHGIDPVEKNFESEKIGITLNRQMRVHRMSLIGLLYGLGLDKFCNITAMHLFKQLDKNNSDDYLDHSDWQFDTDQDPIKHIIQQGFERIVNEYRHKVNFQPTKNIYTTTPGTDSVIYFDNYSNFEHELRPLYRNSFVEFIGCRLYSEPTVNLDEKITNSVYGQNFPILIGSVGTVELFRQSGLDMFDDVVNHAYDTIDNPIDRLYQAVTDNQQLLTDSQKTKQLWIDCQERFEKNISCARINMYRYFEQYILSDCNRVISDLLIKNFNE